MTKIATSIEQSEILKDILPLESADMGWYYSKNQNAGRHQMWLGTKVENADLPAWSLSALFDTMPPIQELCSSTDHYYRVHCMNLFSEWHDNAIDSCVEMILKLHKKELI